MQEKFIIKQKRKTRQNRENNTTLSLNWGNMPSAKKYNIFNNILIILREARQKDDLIRYYQFKDQLSEKLGLDTQKAAYYMDSLISECYIGKDYSNVISSTIKLVNEHFYLKKRVII